MTSLLLLNIINVLAKFLILSNSWLSNYFSVYDHFEEKNFFFF